MTIGNDTPVNFPDPHIATSPAAMLFAFVGLLFYDELLNVEAVT
jgi:hypothetical protein